MATTFRPYEPDQMLLLPRARVAPGGALCTSRQRPGGRLGLDGVLRAKATVGATREPRMMVKVLLYGYATGVFSSRKIARKLEEDVAFRVLGARNFPSHRTLCEFRRRHLEDFKGLFVEVVRVARGLRVLGNCR